MPGKTKTSAPQEESIQEECAKDHPKVQPILPQPQQLHRL